MSKENNKIIEILLFSFSLFEFYYFGIRLFDFAGLFILIGSILFLRKSLAKTTAAVKLFAIYLIFLWAFAIINNFGYLLFTNSTIDFAILKSIVGYSLCFLTFFLILFIKYDKDQIPKTINYLIIFHGLLILLQMINYYVTGSVIDFVPEKESRLISSVFRPAGMYLEPAHYALSMFIFLSIKYLIEKKIDKIFLFSLLTILLSFSLWGIIVAFFFLAFDFFTKISFKKIIYFSSGLLIFIIIIWYIYNHNETIKFLIDYSLFDRADKVFSNEDNSLNGRLGSSLYGDGNFEYSNLFGLGFTSNIVYGGANLLSLLINNFGLIGTLGFYVILLSTSIKKNIIFFFCIILIISSGTHALLSSFLFWAWLAILIRLNSLEASIEIV